MSEQFPAPKPNIGILGRKAHGQGSWWHHVARIGRACEDGQSLPVGCVTPLGRQSSNPSPWTDRGKSTGFRRVEPLR